MGCKLGLNKAVFTNELQRLVGAGGGVLLGLASPLFVLASLLLLATALGGGHLAEPTQ